MRFRLSILFFIIVSSGLINLVHAEEDGSGRGLVFEKSKGNCLACHAIPNDPAAKSPGNIGPALIGMKSRFPDRTKLRAQIWDATVANPRSGMPPFGRNKILTEAEVDLVTDYVLGL